MHALGFIHEHSRPDRDDYITVNYNNVDPRKSIIQSISRLLKSFIMMLYNNISTDIDHRRDVPGTGHNRDVKNGPCQSKIAKNFQTFFVKKVLNNDKKLTLSGARKLRNSNPVRAIS